MANAPISSADPGAGRGVAARNLPTPTLGYDRLHVGHGTVDGQVPSLRDPGRCAFHHRHASAHPNISFHSSLRIDGASSLMYSALCSGSTGTTRRIRTRLVVDSRVYNEDGCSMVPQIFDPYLGASGVTSQPPGRKVRQPQPSKGWYGVP
jgi:hypothetical protein